jgi:photosystem II stability/assembly factor-like uncharacterized protein
MYKSFVLTGNRDGGLMRRSTDSGKNFYQVTFESNTNFTGANWRYIAMDQTQAIAVSNTNVFTTNDSGASWTERTTTSTTNNTGCALYNGLMIVADQENSRLYYSTDNGANWNFQTVNFPRGCAISQNGTTYVVLITGMTTSISAIPSNCNICTNFNPAVTTNTFVNTTYSGAIPFLVALDGKYAVACCQSGGTNKSIKYSTNFGANWTDISENITVNCSAVSISNGYAFVAPTTNTNYYISNNYGQNWQTRTAPATATTVANFSDRGTFFTRSGVNTIAYNGTLI